MKTVRTSTRVYLMIREKSQNGRVKLGSVGQLQLRMEIILGLGWAGLQAKGSS